MSPARMYSLHLRTASSNPSREKFDVQPIVGSPDDLMAFVRKEEPKWRNIGMNFDSDADSDEDLESGMKFPTHRERHAKKMPPMHL